MKKYIADAITVLRIVFSIIMLFCPVFSHWFFVMYLLCGLTDMTDGAAARKLNCADKFGEKLDTAADLVFAAAALIKIIPALNIQKRIFYWICAIAVIKIINIVLCFVINKEFAAIHTIMNKITGFMLFVLPFTLGFINIEYSAVVVCATAMLSAVWEGFYIINGKKC